MCPKIASFCQITGWQRPNLAMQIIYEGMLVRNLSLMCTFTHDCHKCVNLWIYENIKMYIQILVHVCKYLRYRYIFAGGPKWLCGGFVGKFVDSVKRPTVRATCPHTPTSNSRLWQYTHRLINYYHRPQVLDQA